MEAESASEPGHRRTQPLSGAWAPSPGGVSVPPPCLPLKRACGVGRGPGRGHRQSGADAASSPRPSWPCRPRWDALS